MFPYPEESPAAALVPLDTAAAILVPLLLRESLRLQIGLLIKIDTFLQIHNISIYAK